jgi:hypothetical protein
MHTLLFSGSLGRWLTVGLVAVFGSVSLAVRAADDGAALLTAEIRSRYTEYLVGEPIIVDVQLFASSSHAITVLRLVGPEPRYAGLWETEVLDADGRTVAVAPPPPARPALTIRPEDCVEIPAGARLELWKHAQQLPRSPGRHTVRVTYRPRWQQPPVITREFTVNVLPVEPATLEAKEAPPGYRGATVEILKVRTADGCWLYYSQRTGAVRQVVRVVQVNEKATFSVSAREPYEGFPDNPGGLCDINTRVDGEERTYRIHYGQGRLEDDWWANFAFAVTLRTPRPGYEAATQPATRPAAGP